MEIQKVYTYGIYISKAEFLQTIVYIYIYIYIYYTINVVPGFRSDSSLYCYRPVSYGEEMTTLIRQYELILPDECGHLLTIRNRSVAIKR